MSTNFNFEFNDSADYVTSAPDWEVLLTNLSNTTTVFLFEQDERDLWREIPLGIILTFLCLLTTVGNAMVLHAVRTERRLQSVSVHTSAV